MAAGASPQTLTESSNRYRTPNLLGIPLRGDGMPLRGQIEGERKGNGERGWNER
jgi:hypothetical protein